MYINDSLIEQLFITKIQSLEILLRIKQRKKKEEIFIQSLDMISV